MLNMTSAVVRLWLTSCNKYKIKNTNYLVIKVILGPLTGGGGGS